MGIGSQILSSLRSVRMNERVEESAELALGTAPALVDCLETYMRIQLAITVVLVDFH